MFSIALLSKTLAAPITGELFGALIGDGLTKFGRRLANRLTDFVSGLGNSLG